MDDQRPRQPSSEPPQQGGHYRPDANARPHVTPPPFQAPPPGLYPQQSHGQPVQPGPPHYPAQPGPLQYPGQPYPPQGYPPQQYPQQPAGTPYPQQPYAQQAYPPQGYPPPTPQGGQQPYTPPPAADGFGAPNGPAFATQGDTTQGWTYQQPDYSSTYGYPQAAHTAPSHTNPPPAPTGPTRVSLDDIKEMGGRGRWWIWGLVAVLAAAIVIGGLSLNTSSKPEATPSPTPSGSTALPTPKGPQDDVMWVSENAKGTWRVVASEWTPSQVTLKLEVTCTQGSLSYSFMALNNTSSKRYYPSPPMGKPSLVSGRISAGEAKTGYVTFIMPRDAGTVYLQDAQDVPISARAITP